MTTIPAMRPTPGLAVDASGWSLPGGLRAYQQLFIGSTPPLLETQTLENDFTLIILKSNVYFSLASL